jgi:BlaI family penicillinase repressor
MRPARSARRLTDLELEIMQVIWETHPDPLTVRDVVDRLSARGRELAYTTVQTMMTILRRKGALQTRAGKGRAHEYRATWTREETRHSMTSEFVRRLFAGQAQPLLTQLLEHESMSREELADLKRRIERQLEEEEGA